MTITTNTRGRRDDSLREARKRAGLTQAQLAAASDCSLAFIGQLEAGYLPKRSVVLTRIEDALNVALGEQARR